MQERDERPGEQAGNSPPIITGRNSDVASGLGKRENKWPPYDEGARIISYNIDEGERPSGVKIRYKIRIVSGREAAIVDRQQADAIREYLRWVRHYRQSPSSAPGDTPSTAPAEPA